MRTGLKRYTISIDLGGFASIEIDAESEEAAQAFVDGMSYAEICEAAEITIDNVEIEEVPALPEEGEQG